MMYPYSLITERFGSSNIVHQIYFANPLAEAVLLFQRCFWYTSIDRENLPAGFDPSLSANFPAHFYDARG